MTPLLERAISQLQTLSDDEQNAIASRLLAELEDGLQGKAQFASTTNHRSNSPTLQKKPSIKRGKTGKDLLKFVATWHGDDLEECLSVVKGERSSAQF